MIGRISLAMPAKVWLPGAVLMLCTSLLAYNVAGQDSTDPPRELVGLWSAVNSFPDVEHTEIHMYQVEGIMMAEVGPYRFRVKISESGDVSFKLPGNRGRFRGKLQADSMHIEGHWIQPPTQKTFAEMASPVVITREADGSYFGIIQPLRNTMSMYLNIERTDDGRYGTVLRNPEANVGRFYQLYDIEMDGERIQFVDPEGNVELEGRWDASWQRLSVYLPYNGGHYDFSKVDKTDSWFMPAIGSNVSYSIPDETGDGWSTAHSQDVGMDDKVLSELLDVITSEPQNSINALQIHAFLVARSGKLVFEEYFHGYSRDQTHGTRSASKTVTAMLTGVAEHKSSLSRETKIAPILADAGYTNPATSFGEISIENLITMTPGFDCNDSDESSAGGEGVMQSQDEEPDWIRFSVNLPMVAEPGTKAAYCSGSQNLAGSVVAMATNTWLPDYFYEHVAEPLGIEKYQMNLTPTGEAYGGGGLYIRPRDFLKIGRLFLDGGVWNGERILGKSWVRDAVVAHKKIGDEGYGYGWWVMSYPYQDRQVDAYYAGGNGGQYLIVIPELELVVGIFGGNYSQRVQGKSKYEYVPQYVLGSLKDQVVR